MRLSFWNELSNDFKILYSPTSFIQNYQKQVLKSLNIQNIILIITFIFIITIIKSSLILLVILLSLFQLLLLLSFYLAGKPFNIDDINVNNILLSKKEQCGKYSSFKYFIGYNDNDVIKPLYLGLSQMTGYIHKSDEDKNGNKNKNKITMSLKAKDKNFFKNYNKIWKKKNNEYKLI